MTSHIEQAPGGMKVKGALTFATARETRAAGLDLIATHQGGELTVDCSSVTESDSAGLAVLLDWLGAARRHNVTLRFANVPARLTAIAQISEIEDAIAMQAAG